MNGDHEPTSGNDNAAVGDIVRYTFAIKNNGSITLDTVDLLTHPTVSVNPTMTLTAWSEFHGRRGAEGGGGG